MPVGRLRLMWVRLQGASGWADRVCCGHLEELVSRAVKWAGPRGRFAGFHVVVGRQPI